MAAIDASALVKLNVLLRCLGPIAVDFLRTPISVTENDSLVVGLSRANARGKLMIQPGLFPE